MATVAELMVKIGGDISGLERAMSKAQSNLQNAGRSMQRVGRSMTMAVSAPMAAAGAAALNSAAKFESLQQSMNTLNGSVEEGTRNFERLKEFSATTPFQMEDLAEAQNMLQGFGLSADEAFDSMSMIGDIAAVASGDIKGIGIAFGQAAAEGRLMTRDIRQLINQGVPAIKLLSETMNVAESDVLDLASEGEVSFEILQEAMRDATSEGGMFADGMAKQARTLGGIWSTFKDNVSIALADVGQAMAEVFDIKGMADSAIESIQNMLSAFNSMSESTQRMAFYVAGVLGAGGPILIALGTLTAALGAISWPVLLGVSAFGAAAAAILRHWEDIENYFTTGQGMAIWEDLKAIVESTVDIITSVWDDWGETIISITEDSFVAISDIVESSLEAISGVVETWGHVYNLEFRKAFNEAESTAGEHYSNMGRIIKRLFSLAENVDVLGVAGGLESLWEMTGFIPSDEDMRRRVRGQMQDILDEARRGATSVDDSIIEDSIDTDIDMDMGGIGWTLTEGIEKASAGVQKAGGEMASSFSNSIGDMKAEAGSMSNVMDTVTSNMRTGWQGFVNNFKEIGGNFKQFLAEEISGAVIDFGTALGESLSGAENSWQTTFEKITVIVLDFAASLARLAAGIGAVMLFIPGMQGAGAGLLAAATALQAISTGVKAGIEKRAENRQARSEEEVPAMASGGLAFGPTLAVVGDNRGASSNPEVIAPLDKLQGMMGGGGGSQRLEAKIKGSDIHLANERGKNKFR